MFKSKEKLQVVDEQFEAPEYNQSRMELEHLNMWSFLGLTLCGMFLMFFIMYIVNTYPILGLIMLVCVGTLPIMGVAFLAGMLIRFLRKPQIFPIDKVGTIVRLPDGNMQIVSTNEVYAFETKEAPIPQPIIDTSIGDLYCQSAPEMPELPMKVSPVIDTIKPTDPLNNEKEQARKEERAASLRSVLNRYTGNNG